MKEEIIKYYNELAEKYDEDRFSNSYGKYIHKQEQRVLSKYLDSTDIGDNLDLACGTGRFLKYAQYGLDISSEMINISKEKFPDKSITLGDASELPYKDYFFKNVLSFHLFMHLDLAQSNKIFDEVARAMKVGGLFIFDMPSHKRRKLTGYKSKSWHGGNQMDVKKIKAMTSDKWDLVAFHGIAFFPIHRIPNQLRPLFIRLDNLLCRLPFKEWSSHLIFILRKK